MELWCRSFIHEFAIQEVELHWQSRNFKLNTATTTIISSSSAYPRGYLCCITVLPGVDHSASLFYWRQRRGFLIETHDCIGLSSLLLFAFIRNIGSTIIPWFCHVGDFALKSNYNWIHPQYSRHIKKSLSSSRCFETFRAARAIHAPALPCPRMLPFSTLRKGLISSKTMRGFGLACAHVGERSPFRKRWGGVGSPTSW